MQEKLSMRCRNMIISGGVGVGPQKDFSHLQDFGILAVAVLKKRMEGTGLTVGGIPSTRSKDFGCARPRFVAMVVRSPSRSVAIRPKVCLGPGTRRPESRLLWRFFTGAGRSSGRTDEQIQVMECVP